MPSRKSEEGAKKSDSASSDSDLPAEYLNSPLSKETQVMIAAMVVVHSSKTSTKVININNIHSLPPDIFMLFCAENGKNEIDELKATSQITKVNNKIMFVVRNILYYNLLL